MAVATHKCTYANAINLPPYAITNEDGVELCGFCHDEWAPKPTRSTGGTK